MIRVVEDDAAELQRGNVLLVRMLIKTNQHVGFVTRAEDFAGADAHLENRGPAGDGGRNGHERHDFLLTASRQTREETANGLNAVLRVTRDADNCLFNLQYL